MAVQLIDPNDVVNENSFAYGTPEYEKMFIFAELIAQRRGRTIIISKGGGNFDVRKTIDSDLVVNMLGPDRQTSQFTTQWDRNTSGTQSVDEGFGITKINITTNSSFVPVVTIDFVDIRGLAFFNLGKDSPYAVLHDFPPPLFQLTVKGYYGKALTYQLHLVRQNTKFESETGNYYTTAEFIARTFAPLTDVLFKYAEMFPLIKRDTEGAPAPEANAEPRGNAETSDRKIRPNGLHNLLLNIETLYQKIERVLQDSPEKKELEQKEKEYQQLNNLLNEFGRGFASKLDDEEYNDENTALLIKEDSEEEKLFNADKFGYSLKTIPSIKRYQETLRNAEGNGVNLNSLNKIYLGIKLNSHNVPANNPSQNNFDEKKFKKAQNILNNYRVTLLKDYPQSVLNELDIVLLDTGSTDVNNAIYNFSEPRYLLEQINNDTWRKTYYAVIDATVFYQKAFKYYVENIVNEIEQLEQELGDIINNLAIDELEMLPTVRNIFKIICDDVDIFFNTLRTTSVKAQDHHNQPSNKTIILNNKTDLPEEQNERKINIDAFPLYIEQTTENDSSTNCRKVTRRQKAYPGKPKGIGVLTPEPFPEVDLVERFIETYIDIRNDELVRNFRQKQDERGDLIFIPSTPYDSVLGNENAYDSPYLPANMNTTVTGEEAPLNSILKILLDRFYVFSQYTYAETFYNGNDVEFKNAIAKFGGEAEASNLALSLINSDNIDNIVKQLEIFNDDINLFYDYLENNGISNYSINQSSILFGKGNSQFTPIIKNKNSQYFGLKILNNSNISEKVSYENNAVGELLNSTKDNSFFKKYLSFFTNDDSQKIQFSQENVQLIKDFADSKSSKKTRYLINDKRNPKNLEALEITIENSMTKKLAQIFGYEDEDKTASSNAPSSLFKSDEILLNFLNDGTITNDVKLFLITSLFTFSKSIFSEYKDNVLLDIPSVIIAPSPFILYSAGLLDYESKYKDKLEPLFTRFKRQFLQSNELAYRSDSTGQESVDDFILNKELQYVQFLTESDKNELRSFYTSFINLNGNTILTSFINLLESGINSNWDVETYLENIENDYNDLLSPLFEQVALVNYSELTLTRGEITEESIGTDPTQFISLANTNSNPVLSGSNEQYFKAFIRKGLSKIKSREKFLENQEFELLSSLEDTDIKTQCYYSFKNISDKWLAGLGNTNIGFPFNQTPFNEQQRSGGLIDQFVFVDRAFNDIGDKVIINLKPLLDFANDYDSSVFSVMSRILSLNGFEFFPLQNFMSFKSQDWENSFKISETAEQDEVPAFVCMYVGGVSSKLNNVAGFDSVFENDGINSLEEKEDIPDFYDSEINDCLDSNINPSTTNNEQQRQDIQRNKLESAKDLQFNQVKAFRVRFGEQEQAIFKNINLDTREFKDTNESLAILSEIAQDKSYSTPVPKGQNLFNTFEQRSYSCTIEMLGDMMIQPTQYFQLENIPMFSGAYLILNVEHEFIPNHATTSFMGVRILKYPVPYVTDFASTAGLKSSSSREGSTVNPNRDLSQEAIAYIGMNELKINIT
jgi:hypothetical protein